MSPKRILIAEDRLDHRKVMKDLLFSVGYDVILAENSAEAEEILRTDSGIDLIVLDYALLPDNGVRLMQKIKSHLAFRCYRQIPLIFVTAYPENEDLVAVKNRNIPVLSKPFRHYQDFLDAVKNQLANQAPKKGG